MKVLLALLLAVTLAAGCAHEMPTHSAARKFDFNRDSFAFTNETVWRYEDGKPVTEGEEGVEALNKQKGERFTRRCFVMARAALQFWKFARFDPKHKPLDDATLAARVRDVTDRDVWEQQLPAEK